MEPETQQRECAKHYQASTNTYVSGNDSDEGLGCGGDMGWDCGDEGLGCDDGRDWGCGDGG